MLCVTLPRCVSYKCECVLVCISWIERSTFNGNPHPSHRCSKFKWDIFLSCLLAMRHINMLRKYAERLGKKIFHIYSEFVCMCVCIVWSAGRLQMWCECVEVKQQGIRDYTKFCGSRRESLIKRQSISITTVSAVTLSSKCLKTL